jgi:hypothetical protein
VMAVGVTLTAMTVVVLAWLLPRKKE